MDLVAPAGLFGQAETASAESMLSRHTIRPGKELSASRSCGRHADSLTHTPMVSTAVNSVVHKHPRRTNQVRDPLRASGDSQLDGDVGSTSAISERHQLVSAFQDSATGYRRFVHNAIMLKLDQALLEQRMTLRENHLTATCSPDDSVVGGQSLIQIAVVDKYKRDIKQYFDSISAYIVTNRHMCEEGGERKNPRALATILGCFDEEYRREIREILQLEESWERIVREIWKTGTSSLGAQTMAALLIKPAELRCERFDPPLSVSETTGLDDDCGGCVTSEPPTSDHSTSEHTHLPGFIQVYQNLQRANPCTFSLTQGVIQSLLAEISKLGAAQSKEMQAIKSEEQKWWNTKSKHIAMALRD